jgi:hypothetical protein
LRFARRKSWRSVSPDFERSVNTAYMRIQRTCFVAIGSTVAGIPSHSARPYAGAAEFSRRPSTCSIGSAKRDQVAVSHDKCTLFAKGYSGAAFINKLFYAGLSSSCCGYCQDCQAPASVHPASDVSDSCLNGSYESVRLHDLHRGSRGSRIAVRGDLHSVCRPHSTSSTEAYSHDCG